MVPHPYVNASSTQPYATDNSSQSDLVTNIVFGILAALASSITIWQGCRVWKAQRNRSSPDNGSVAENTSSDLELGTWAPRRHPTNDETLDDTASASPSLDTNTIMPNEGSTLAEPIQGTNGSALAAENVTTSDEDHSRVAVAQDQTLSSQAQTEEDIEQNIVEGADVDPNLAIQGSEEEAAIAG